jgi:hypothetical protein
MIDKLRAGTNNLFQMAPDCKLADFIEEVLKLGESFPEIYRRIEADQDDLGKKKKLLRLQDKAYKKNKTADLPAIKFCPPKISSTDLSLETGRPRMRAELLLLFVCLRGYWGSVTDCDVVERIEDSMTFHVLLDNLNMKTPSRTTMLENANCLSRETLDLILERQLSDIKKNGLDDFAYALFDSTSVKASSSWPTDSGLIYRLLGRVYATGMKLDDFGIKSIQPFYFEHWMQELKKLLFKINNATGTKACSKKKKLCKLYGDYLKIAHKGYEYLLRIFELRSSNVKDIDLRPGAKSQLLRIHNKMEDDLLAVSNVLYYSEERVFNGVVLPAAEKILSLSDSTAAFIKKGQRNPVIGYKPQLCQSRNGFVTGMLLEQGNASDSAKLFSLAQLHKKNTGVVPEFISADDGYSSMDGRKKCLDFGVKDVCLSGSKGKKITPAELWESSEYIAGRRKRSAIESLMFTLKYVHEFGAARRRGIENVRAELTEEIIAYNFKKKLEWMAKLKREEEGLCLKKTA